MELAQLAFLSRRGKGGSTKVCFCFCLTSIASHKPQRAKRTRFGDDQCSCFSLKCSTELGELLIGEQACDSYKDVEADSAH